MNSGLSEIHLPAGCSRKLENLEIRDVRQLYARMQRDRVALQRYLALPDADFEALSRELEALVASRYPQDRLPHAHPTVNKTGVAANRLYDPARPRFGTRSRRSR